MRIVPYLLVFACAPAAAQGIEAQLRCNLTRTDYVYDCAIKLARGGRPLAGADVTVDADMPSMPKAHNTPPVKAKAGGKAGEYAARLDLEMLGEWAVRLRFSRPVREQLTLLYEFDEKGARPVTRSGKLPRN